MTELPPDDYLADELATAADIASANTPQRRWGCMRAGAIPLIGIWLLLSLFLAFLVEIPFHLAFGWLIFVVTVLPRIEFDFSQAAFCLALLVGFAFGLHQLCRRLLNPSWSISASWRITGLAIIAFVAGTSVVGVAHQTIWLARQDQILDSPEALFRMRSRGNLKQIGLAFHNYHDTYGSFPTVPQNSIGLPTHSWATALLPYIDQANLTNKMDLRVPSDAEPNTSVAGSLIPTYLNPAINLQHDSSADFAPIHYAANIHVQANRGMKISDVTDGTSNTLLIGGINTRIPAWSAPGNWRDPALGINRVPHGFGSPFEGMCHFLMMDGSVQSFSKDIDPDVLKALATPAGGETVGEY